MLNFMKIELDNNKVFFRDENLNEEIHPFWLRERINSEDYVDTVSYTHLTLPTT